MKSMVSAWGQGADDRLLREHLGVPDVLSRSTERCRTSRPSPDYEKSLAIFVGCRLAYHLMVLGVLEDEGDGKRWLPWQGSSSWPAPVPVRWSRSSISG